MSDGHPLTLIRCFTAGALGLLAGCAATDSADQSADRGASDVTITAGEGATLVPTREPPAPDLPVPIGFDIDRRASRSYVSDDARVIDHTYRGPAEPAEAERFYRYQMPLNGWRFRGVQKVADRTTLRFEKGPQWCDVHIETWNRTFGSSGTQLHVVVQTLNPPDESG